MAISKVPLILKVYGSTQGKKVPSFSSIVLRNLFIVFLSLSLGIGCYTKKIEEAFDGDFSSKENNQIINDYCKGCHIHREFEPSEHVKEVAKQYRRKVFRFTSECRTCHYLEKKFSLNDFLRKTRRPKEANQGKFREFEIQELRSKKK